MHRSDVTPGAAGRDRRGRSSHGSTLSWRRLGAAAAVVPCVVLGLSPSASAHVTVTPSTTAAGSHAVLDVSISHGCQGSSTTEIAIQIPDAINSVTPTRKALWEVEKQTVRLDPPVADGHGNEITERVASVTYRTDEPLPEGYRDVFELSLQLPDAEGSTLVFPAVQTCERGESAWIEVPEEGQSGEGLELPAPAFVITAAEAGGHDEETPATTSAGAQEPRAASPTAQRSDDSDALAAGALGAGALGALLGGAALLRQRRRT